MGANLAIALWGQDNGGSSIPDESRTIVQDYVANEPSDRVSQAKFPGAPGMGTFGSLESQKSIESARSIAFCVSD